MSSDKNQASGRDWRSTSLQLGGVIAFWFFAIVLSTIATAQSEKRWDTFIAATAMISQTFFAFAVWRLGQSQFEFSRKASERQHKIDMYPLREKAYERLRLAMEPIFDWKRLTLDQADEFVQCYLVVKNVFSDDAGQLAYETYQAAEDYFRAVNAAQPTIDAGGSISKPVSLDNVDAIRFARSRAIDAFTDAQDALDQELSIR